jgi:transposase-like protein
VWRQRYGKLNEHNALIPRDHWLLDEEKAAILAFHDRFPLEAYRRLAFMMIDQDVAAASPSSVYRVLGGAGVLDRWNRRPTKKGTGFVQPLRAHEHWHIDVAYLNLGGTFYYLCSVLDGASRYIVHWEIREAMTEADVECILERAREMHPGARPRVISDNGPQFIAKDFKEFIRLTGMTHVRTAPYYPQSNGKIERWHKTIKGDAIRPGKREPRSTRRAPSSQASSRTTTTCACTAPSATSRPLTSSPGARPPSSPNAIASSTSPARRAACAAPRRTRWPRECCPGRRSARRLLVGPPNHPAAASGVTSGVQRPLRLRIFQPRPSRSRRTSTFVWVFGPDVLGTCSCWALVLGRAAPPGRVVGGASRGWSAPLRPVSAAHVARATLAPHTGALAIHPPGGRMCHHAATEARDLAEKSGGRPLARWHET